MLFGLGICPSNTEFKCKFLNTHPSITSATVKVLVGVFVVAARLVLLGVFPRFGDALALFPAWALPPFFFCYSNEKKKRNNQAESYPV